MINSTDLESNTSKMGSFLWWNGIGRAHFYNVPTSSMAQAISIHSHTFSCVQSSWLRLRRPVPLANLSPLSVGRIYCHKLWSQLSCSTGHRNPIQHWIWGVSIRNRPSWVKLIPPQRSQGKSIFTGSYLFQKHTDTTVKCCFWNVTSPTPPYQRDVFVS